MYMRRQYLMQQDRTSQDNDILSLYVKDIICVR